MYDWYTNPPEITAMELWVVTSFQSLSTDRDYGGFTIGPIPERDIYAYAVRAGLDWWNRQLFYILIRALDAFWLESQKSKSAKQDPKRKR